jgi:hypothetical protein
MAVVNACLSTYFHEGRCGNIMKKAVVAVATALAGMLFFVSSPIVDAQSSKVTYLAWYMYPITQYYNGATEFGEDLGTPEWTPVTSLVSGWLVGAGFYGGGGVVTVRTNLNGASADLYVQHLDSIVNVGLCAFGACGGRYVRAGELIGYSGGDCNWHYGPGYGNFNPCVSHFSNGSHIEVGINPPWYSIWGPYPHPGRNYNPHATLLALINGGTHYNTFIYVVRAGDTLAFIAGRYHLSWRQLYRLNASVIGSNPNRIYSGERLTIP